MFRTLDDFNDQPFHATGIGAILIFEGQISSKRIQPTGLWTIHFIEALLAERKSVSFKVRRLKKLTVNFLSLLYHPVSSVLKAYLITTNPNLHFNLMEKLHDIHRNT